MKLSRKSDYALRALMSLVARRDSGLPISVRELAEENDIPPRFLEQILLDLKRVGVVSSIAGRIGGFLLAKSPEEVTLGQIIRHFDGVLAPIGCVSTTHYEPCSQESKCRFRRVLLDIRNYIAKSLDQLSLADAYRGAPVRSEEVFSPEFGYADGI
jgi:Rrf2 family protein